MGNIRGLIGNPSGPGVSALDIRGALKTVGVVRAIHLRGSLFSIAFEKPIAEVPPPVTIRNMIVTWTEDAGAGVSKGTVFSSELMGCSVEDLKAQLTDPSICGVEALPTRTRESNSGRFRVLFTGQVPEKLLLDCGLSLQVRAQIPMPLRCRKCFDYWHHEDQCRKGAVCSGCGLLPHPTTECTRMFCTACHTEGHSVKSVECPKWQQARETQRVSRENHISITAAKKIVYVPAPAPSTSAWSTTNHNFNQSTTPVNTSQTPSQPPPQQDAIMIALLNTLTEISAGLRAQTTLLSQISQQNQEILIALGNTANASRVLQVSAKDQTPASSKRVRPPKKADLTPTEDLISPEGKKLKQGTLDSLLRKNALGPLDLAKTAYTVNLGRDPSAPSSPTVATFDMRHIDALQPKNTQN